MKKLLLVLLLPISNCLVAQVTYVNYFDAIYPYVVNQANYYPYFDVNQDGIGDFRVQTDASDNISFLANGQNKLIIYQTLYGGIAIAVIAILFIVYKLISNKSGNNSMDYRRSNSRRRRRNDDDDGDLETYFEISSTVDPMTSSVSLQIIDFASPEDKESAILLWNQQVGDLKRILGA